MGTRRSKQIKGYGPGRYGKRQRVGSGEKRTKHNVIDERKRKKIQTSLR